MKNLFKNLFKKDTSDTPLDKPEDKVVTSIKSRYFDLNDKKIEYDITINQRVFVRSNEPGPLETGEIVGFDLISKAKIPMPLVKYDSDDKIYLCFSTIIPMDGNESLYQKLLTMEDIEQWNYLSNSNCQLSEKHGKKYKTYKK